MNITFSMSTPVLADELGLDRDATAGWIGSNYDDFVAACVAGGLAAIKAANLPVAPPPTEEAVSTPENASSTEPPAPDQPST